ncbi:MAG: Cell division protein ZapA [Burkholderia sp.]|jgi:cell division protein ZapA (FtsZ GTPase activity inhibitor)
MPEVTVSIFNRSYRLAVSTGEEQLIKDCAQTVDKQMQAIREGGKISNQDQIAVLAALEVAYEAKKKESNRSVELNRKIEDQKTEIEELKARISELENRPAGSAEESILKEVDALSKLCEKAIFSDMRKTTVL